MAKKNEEEGFVDVGQVYSKSEDFVNKNGKMLVSVVVGLAMLVAGYFLYQNMVVKPKNVEAQTKMWRAEYYFNQDSLDLALEGSDEYYGFKNIISDYPSTASGNLAKYYAGVISLKQGKYDEAIKYLSDCSFDSNVILESLRLGNIGDAYIEKGDIGKGIDFFNQSVSSAENTATSPIYLKKMGLAYESQGNTAEALAAYKKLKVNFASSQEAQSIDKYIGLLEK